MTNDLQAEVERVTAERAEKERADVEREARRRLAQRNHAEGMRERERQQAERQRRQRQDEDGRLRDALARKFGRKVADAIDLSATFDVLEAADGDCYACDPTLTRELSRGGVADIVAEGLQARRLGTVTDRLKGVNPTRDHLWDVRAKLLRAERKHRERDQAKQAERDRQLDERRRYGFDLEKPTGDEYRVGVDGTVKTI